ncbi:MAG: hypothetical protein KZQ87_18650 [Candidatus Thiodiazotropha sp. (ex Cardiolucina cf. quadrata)]|nr:hypothetical protein [Candidatus Thiodiazotropha sp. (ex Cardiolucina cf. quadrata)]
MTYPLLVVGSGLSAGITIAASTTFNKVKLPFPCRYWDGALVEMYTAGTTVIVGSTETQLRFRLTNGQQFSMKSSGFGVNLDVSINWGTMQIGSLGPKTREVAY